MLRRAGELIPFRTLHEMFDVSDTLHRFATGIWNEKKQAHAEGKLFDSAEMGRGRDILGLLRAYRFRALPSRTLTAFLVEENSKSAIEDKLPENELIAQINNFRSCAAFHRKHIY